jgi:DNA-binding MarR family transcriptional regulator
MDAPLPRPHKPAAPFRHRRVAENELLGEITSAARCIAAARDWHGDPVFRTDGVWRVLATVASSPYCLAIADLARALGVRRQVAHELAHAAARKDLIELASNPHDKRILQALLTPRGRSQLAAARIAESIWLTTLLNGLGDHDLAAATHVVRVVRQRLERDARELARRDANLPRS